MVARWPKKLNEPPLALHTVGAQTGMGGKRPASEGAEGRAR